MILGLPIINSQTNKEVIELINLATGAHYKAGSVDSFYQVSIKLLDSMQGEYSINSTINEEIVERFDRNISYNKITTFISNFI
jgi:hypothetical protein